MTQSTKSRTNDEGLLSFGRSYLANAFPNPERVGCPSGNILRQMAENPRSTDLLMTEHIGTCSPCFEEYQKLLAEARIKQSHSALRALLVPRLAATLVLVLVAMVVFAVLLWRSHNPRVTKKQKSSEESSEINVAHYLPFTLDMRQAAHDRGGSETEQTTVTIPRKPLHVSAYLPIGSDSGNYKVLLKKESQLAWSGSSSAQRQGAHMVMTFDCDFRQVPAGHYSLVVVSQAGLRLTQKVSIEDQSITR